MYSLRKLSNIHNYQPEVTMETLDASGAVTDQESEIEGWNYYITIKKWRNQDIWMPYTDTKDLVAGNVPVSLTVERIQEHSPPMRGFYTLSIDGYIQKYDSDSYNIPYSAGSWKVEKMI